jgi:hypothetical protein
MAEPFSTSAAAKRLPADVAGIGEVEVLDRDGVAAAGRGRANRGGDGSS